MSDSQENQLNVKKTDGKYQMEKGPKSVRQIAKERRLKILDTLIKSVGFRNARGRTKSLAEKYKIDERNIRKDFVWIKKNIKVEDREEIKITVRIAIDKALDKALERFVIEPSIENSQKIMSIAKGYREELEAWGEKEKVADKHQVEGIITTFKIIEKSVEEIKDAKNKGIDSEPEADRDVKSS